jgi:hypothetical protein
MNRTFLVLALALLGCGGCRTMGPNCGQACSSPGGESYGQSSDKSCDSCHMMTMKNAPRPEGCCEGSARSSGHGGDVETACPGGNCCVFDRYQGSECGPQYPPGPYDCSPCSSCNWGCNGHQHPFGYKTGHERYCQNDGCNGQPNCVCQHCGRGYCCGTGPAPGCSCCPFCGCGPSGDQNYNFNPGPPVAQTAYPYYTLRGPRDFLLNNPPSIGPY